MHTLRRFNVGAAAVLGLLILCLGCAKSHEPTYPVHGLVTLNGKPATGGGVVFESVESGSTGRYYSARAVIGADGQYRLGTFGANDGAVAGKHRATVFSEEDKTPSDKSPAASARRSHRFIAPPKFGSSDTSGLEFEVKAGENTINIELHN
jgi:hypothetical protein